MRLLAIAGLLGSLVACGDNGVPVGFDSIFETPGLRVFGSVQLFEAVGTPPTPLTAIEVCLEDTCGPTNAEDASFVLDDPSAPLEAVFVADDGDPDHLPTVVGTSVGTLGERNLSTVLVFSRALVAATATAYGHEIDPTLGTVLMLAVRFDEATTIEVALDGSVPDYLGDDQLPDPGRSSLGRAGSVIFYNVAPGEATIRTTAGRCNVDEDGWPAAKQGELRVPVRADHVTLVHPYCIGD